MRRLFSWKFRMRLCRNGLHNWGDYKKEQVYKDRIVTTKYCDDCETQGQTVSYF